MGNALRFYLERRQRVAHCGTELQQVARYQYRAALQRTVAGRGNDGHNCDTLADATAKETDGDATAAEFECKCRNSRGSGVHDSYVCWLPLLVRACCGYAGWLSRLRETRLDKLTGTLVEPTGPPNKADVEACFGSQGRGSSIGLARLAPDRWPSGAPSHFHGTQRERRYFQSQERLCMPMCFERVRKGLARACSATCRRRQMAIQVHGLAWQAPSLTTPVALAFDHDLLCRISVNQDDRQSCPYSDSRRCRPRKSSRARVSRCTQVFGCAGFTYPAPIHAHSANRETTGAAQQSIQAYQSAPGRAAAKSAFPSLSNLTVDSTSHLFRAITVVQGQCRPALRIGTPPPPTVGALQTRQTHLPFPPWRRDLVESLGPPAKMVGRPPH